MSEAAPEAPALPARFIAKIEVDQRGCWRWTSTKSSGYARFTVGTHANHKLVLAHRYAYEALVGPIPDGLQLDHLCRVTDCVNPAHLEPVTARENTMRGETITAAHAAQVECVNGHEFTPSNTYWRPTGGRACRECGRIRWREWNAKRKAR